MQATAQSDIVSPVGSAELATFMGVDASDPLLPAMLEAATDAVVRYINQDLVPRQWVGIVPAPTASRLQLSPYIDPTNTFELPYTALLSVDSVTGNGGESLTYSVQSERRPAKITVEGWDYMSEISVAYTAGMPSVPSAIRTAIQMLAAFLYDHRGGCDAGEALSKSGAVTLLRPYRVEVSL